MANILKRYDAYTRDKKQHGFRRVVNGRLVTYAPYVVNNGLPTGYILLDYIESSGTQYIDTGYKPNGNSRVVMDFEPLSTSLINRYYTYFGCRTAGNKNFFALVKALNTSYNIYWQYGTKYSNIWTIADIDEYAKRRIVDASGASTTMDGVTKTYPVTEFQSDFNMFLFCNNQNGQANMLSVARIYSCQIYDNGTLVRDYVPCIDADGNVGMYDKQNKVFYGNAGSGAFVAGYLSAAVDAGGDING